MIYTLINALQELENRQRTIDTLTTTVRQLTEELADVKMTLANKKGFKNVRTSGKANLDAEVRLSKDLKSLGASYIPQLLRPFN